MSLFERLKKEYQLTKAFQHLFLDENKALKPDGKVILSYLCDVCAGRGELGKKGESYYYDKAGHFDAGSAGFRIGMRRVYDLIIKHLCLDDVVLFRVLSQAQAEQSEEDSLKNLINL